MKYCNVRCVFNVIFFDDYVHTVVVYGRNKRRRITTKMINVKKTESLYKCYRHTHRKQHKLELSI